jgi:hypothetical protein
LIVFTLFVVPATADCVAVTEPVSAVRPDSGTCVATEPPDDDPAGAPNCANAALLTIKQIEIVFLTLVLTNRSLAVAAR